MAEQLPGQMGIFDFVDDPEKQNDIIVTSFGKTFYHNSPAALKRN